MSCFFWKKTWKLLAAGGHVAAPGAAVAAVAAGCWQMRNTWKMPENTMKYMYIQHRQHVSKIHEIHKHMLEYIKTEQKTHDKTLS